MALVQHGPKRSGDQNTNALKHIQLCCASSLIPRQLAAGSLITQGDTTVVIDWIEGGMTESEEVAAAFIGKWNHFLVAYALKVEYTAHSK